MVPLVKLIIKTKMSHSAVLSRNAVSANIKIFKQQIPG